MSISQIYPDFIRYGLIIIVPKAYHVYQNRTIFRKDKVMASYQKRGNTWRVLIRRNTPVAITRTFDTKSEAMAWATKIEAELQGMKHGKLPSHTLAEAFERYIREVSIVKKGHETEKRRILIWLETMPFVDKLLKDITTPMLVKWRDKRLKDKRLKNKELGLYVTISPATVAREMNILRAVFEVCRREWHWIEENPMKDIRKPPKSKDRDKRVSDDDIERICEILGYEQDTAVSTMQQQAACVVLLAVETAMRRGEILGLTWDRVNLQKRFVKLIETKNGDSRNVPLSKRAIAVFEQMRQVKMPISSPVFSITDDYYSKRFATSCKQLGIEGIRGHDLRHEAITRLAQKLAIADLARMVGHKDLRSLSIYYNATATEIAHRLD